MKKLLLVTGFCFQLFIAKAQTYDPGYIVHTDSDTIYGYIQNGTDAELATGMNFRIDLQTLPEFFGPGEINSFGFNSGRFFVSQLISDNKNKFSKHIFVKNIISGKVDLFIWNHPQRYKPDFFIRNNETGEEAHLKRPEAVRTASGRRKIPEAGGGYIKDLQKVLGDSADVSEDLDYSEKNIRNLILEYNNNFDGAHPVRVYEAKFVYNLNVLAGIPIRFKSQIDGYRAAVFLERVKPERKNNFLLTGGIIYHHSKNPDDVPAEPENGIVHLQDQILNLVPVAIKFQGDQKTFQPYGYAGAGIGILWEKNRIIENNNEAGTSTDTQVIPTLNFGIGAKIRTGENAFLTEFTPTRNGLFFNLGYSF